MPNSLTLTFILLAILLIGSALGYFLGLYISKLRQSQEFLSRTDVDKSYISTAVHEQLQQQADMWREDLLEKTQAEQAHSARAAALERDLHHLQEKLNEQVSEINRLQEESRLVFENVANRLLDEKSEKFTKHNQEKLGEILNPLREKIVAFEQNMQHRLQQESRDRLSLQKEIEHLRSLNQQLSTDANNLVTALKGEQKMQGDWGEWQLERLLERSGLERDTHFRTQTSYRDTEGKLKRPDFIIELPEGRQLIIDCKLSLVAYERYCSTDNEKEQALHLRAHKESMRTHMTGLSAKNYQNLYKINCPDYVLLFVPIEPAYNLAIRHDPQLFTDALDRNVVIVTASTLLATMRTVSFLWKQEKQHRSVIEIAQQSGRLYDKFVTFVNDLQEIGQRIDQSQRAYLAAMNKLKDSSKRGDTLIGRAERIRELGALASKKLPRELLDD